MSILIKNKQKIGHSRKREKLIDVKKPAAVNITAAGLGQSCARGRFQRKWAERQRMRMMAPLPSSMESISPA